jgi:tetratricopeptide (TPR) repeat protein
MNPLREDMTDGAAKPLAGVGWAVLAILTLIILVLAAVFLGRIERLQKQMADLNGRLERLENAGVGTGRGPTSWPSALGVSQGSGGSVSTESVGDEMAAVLLAREALDQPGDGPEAAIDILQPAVDRDPGAYGPRLWLGIAMLQGGQSDAALTHFVELAKHHPQRAEPLHWQGIALIRLHQPEQASTLFRSAIELEAAFAPAWLYLGLAEANADRLDAAVELLEGAIRLAPESAEAYFAMAVCRLRRDEPEAAVTAFVRAVDLNPNMADRAKQARLFRDIDDRRLDAIWK